jgi:hypothetical protein
MGIPEKGQHPEEVEHRQEKEISHQEKEVDQWEKEKSVSETPAHSLPLAISPPWVPNEQIGTELRKRSTL